MGPFALVLLMTGLYAAVALHTFHDTAVDVGDYAYVSWRIAQGARLYRDVVGTQTPLIYLLGAAAYRLRSQSDVFALFALTVRLLTMLGVFALARRCRFPVALALLAFLIYAVLPMGFFFDNRFEPNILITLGGILTLGVLTRLSPRTASLAGVGCALCVLAKLTFLPILGAVGVYLVLTNRPLLRPFLLATTGSLIAAFAIGWIGAGHDFVEGALLGEAGQPLAWDNLEMSVHYLWTVEGITILAALAGGVLGARAGGPRRLLAFYLAGSLLTVAATLKSGSLAPELLVAEPAIALCAALTLQRGLLLWRRRSAPGSRVWIMLLLPPLAAILVAAQILEWREDWLTVTATHPSSQLSCEVAALNQAAYRGNAVIAPPYAAFLARRPLVDGVIDYYAWYFHVRAGYGSAVGQANDVARRLRDHGVPIVILAEDQLFPPQDQQALAGAYTSAQSCPGTRIFVPKAASPADRAGR
jgi:hypothetical protein